MSFDFFFFKTSPFVQLYICKSKNKSKTILEEKILELICRNKIIYVFKAYS